jgi:tetratricopeptide (TPR) repeat protein
LHLNFLKVRKSQWILVFTGAVVVFCLYVFGRIVPKNTESPNNGQVAAADAGGQVAPAKFTDILAKAKQPLTPTLQLRLSNLESSITRGNIKEQGVSAYGALAKLWDSLGNVPIAAHYLGEEAKLENSENSLTFAANLFLTHSQHAQDPAVRAWEATEAQGLLQQAAGLAPHNDTIQVALANSEVQSGNVMQGVQRLLNVTANDPNNIQANLLLGRLSVTSGQYDKAVERLQKVVNQQPDNTEALYFLAEAYKATGKKKEAIAMFEKVKALVHDTSFSNEIDQYIQSFK